MTIIEDYINEITSRCEKRIQLNKNLLKIDNKDMNENSILNITNYNNITKYNYNIQQLKEIAKFYKLKLSGNKKELLNRIFVFLHLSSYIIKIQKLFRGVLFRRFLSLFGPALKNRTLCTNDMDFVTMDSLNDLPLAQFFSYKDIDGFVYGFDISSIYNLIFKKNDHFNDYKIGGINPYNRNKIPSFVMINLKMIIRIGKILKIKIDLDFDTNIGKITNEKTLEMRALTLFQNIDSLGNYSSPEWFLSLNRNQLLKFMRELCDIWNYRAQLSIEVKRNICPPTGDPFRNFSISYVTNENDLISIKKYILDILERFVNNGIDKDSKSLGAYYVLGALTLVNDSAASSLPWLYQSVCYF
jgi:hypothetical protein